MLSFEECKKKYDIQIITNSLGRIWRSRGDAAEDSCLPECEIVSTGKLLPTFQRNVVSPKRLPIIYQSTRYNTKEGLNFQTSFFFPVIILRDANLSRTFNCSTAHTYNWHLQPVCSVLCRITAPQSGRQHSHIYCDSIHNTSCACKQHLPYWLANIFKS